jgi:hypothetical protein
VSDICTGNFSKLFCASAYFRFDAGRTGRTIYFFQKTFDEISKPADFQNNTANPCHLHLSKSITKALHPVKCTLFSLGRGVLTPAG